MKVERPNYYLMTNFHLIQCSYILLQLFGPVLSGFERNIEKKFQPNEVKILPENFFYHFSTNTVSLSQTMMKITTGCLNLVTTTIT